MPVEHCPKGVEFFREREVWKNLSTKEILIVRGHSDLLVNFVNLEGVQSKLQFKNEVIDPSKWEFMFGLYSENGAQCSIEYCNFSAFILYQRPLESYPEIVCLWHIPRGIKSSISRPKNRSPDLYVRRGVKRKLCAKCGEGATEVICELEEGSLWNCQTCNLWWLHIKNANPVLINESELIRSLPSGYRLSNQDLKASCDIYIDPVSVNVEAPRFNNLYDHLKSDGGL